MARHTFMSWETYTMNQQARQVALARLADIRLFQTDILMALDDRAHSREPAEIAALRRDYTALSTERDALRRSLED